ncbi:MAG: endonuclease/exonuclease/phosphatase [Actinomycetota bacterium]|nr:endonuclease/exonuclease/phosphatase [Actinomycetota bacterium]
MPSAYYIAWWNVENLFDEENSPRRTDKVARALGKSIVGWTPALRDRKINQLTSVIVRMNAGNGPDLLGICEVENEFIVNRLTDAVNALLPGRAYQVVHADTVDERGIDIAFLFDPALFTAPADQRFQHVVMRRTATREIFQVNFRTHRGRTWAIFGNHWPSRSGGQMESAGYRAIAGETLAYFHQRVWEVHGKSTPVLAMGDFNDEPFDLSLIQYALSTRQRAKVLSGPSPRLWNLMWHILGTGEGTLYFDNFANLFDQFLVNRNMARQTSPIRASPDSVELIRFPGMVSTGTYPAPVPFGGMGKPVNADGYSDHFPIVMTAHEAD